MAGLASGLAAGLEVGANLGLRARQQKLDEDRYAKDEEHRKFAEGLATSADVRAQRDSDIAAFKAAHDTLTASHKQVSEKLDELAAATHGNPTPEQQAEMEPLMQLQERLSSQRDDVATRLSRLALEDDYKEAAQTAEDLKAGKTPDPLAVYKATALATGHDPQTLPQFRVAYRGLQDAIQKGDGKQAVRYANIVYADDLSHMDGHPAGDGYGRHVGRMKIAGIYPVPGQQGKFTVALEAKVKRKVGDHEETGTVTVPWTEGRSSRKDDPVKVFDVNQEIEKIAMKSSLAHAVEHPDFAATLAEGAKNGGTDWLENNFKPHQLRWGAPHKTKTEFQAIPYGGAVIEQQTDENGNVIGSKVLYGPARAPGSGGLAGLYQFIADNPEMDKDAAIQMYAVEQAAARGKAPPTQHGLLTWKDAKEIASRMKKKSENGYTEEPLTPEEVNDYASRLMEDSARVARPEGSPDRAVGLMQAGGIGNKAPAPPAPSNPAQRVRGQVYQTPRGELTWTGTGWVQ